MAEVYRLNETYKSTRATFFDRRELNQLLSLYSRRVMNGEWRDYAIDQCSGSAIFSVFKHTHDSPIFTIVKRMSARGQRRDYVVTAGHETLKRAETLSEALSVFERNLRVVS